MAAMTSMSTENAEALNRCGCSPSYPTRPNLRAVSDSLRVGVIDLVQLALERLR